MDSIILILLVLSNIGLVLYFFSKRNNNNQSDLILKISNNLTNQVQDIRKEISENSEKSRVEIESKLQNINKEISEFQMSSKTQMHWIFYSSGIN